MVRKAIGRGGCIHGLIPLFAVGIHMCMSMSMIMITYEF